MFLHKGRPSKGFINGNQALNGSLICYFSLQCLLFNDIMVFAMQGPRDRSEIEMTLELRTLWFDDLKKQDPQTSKNKYIVNKVVVQSQKQFFFFAK